MPQHIHKNDKIFAMRSVIKRYRCDAHMKNVVSEDVDRIISTRITTAEKKRKDETYAIISHNRQVMFRQLFSVLNVFEKRIDYTLSELKS